MLLFRSHRRSQAKQHRRVEVTESDSNSGGEKRGRTAAQKDSRKCSKLHKIGHISRVYPKKLLEMIRTDTVATATAAEMTATEHYFIATTGSVTADIGLVCGRRVRGAQI